MNSQDREDGQSYVASPGPPGAGRKQGSRGQATTGKPVERRVSGFPSSFEEGWHVPMQGWWADEEPWSDDHGEAGRFANRPYQIHSPPPGAVVRSHGDTGRLLGCRGGGSDAQKKIFVNMGRGKQRPYGARREAGRAASAGIGGATAASLNCRASTGGSLNYIPETGCRVNTELVQHEEVHCYILLTDIIQFLTRYFHPP